MLGSRHRFHGYGSLKAVYQRGQTVRGELIGLRFSSRNHNNYRVAVVVSRKVSKSAVVRNRIRRRVYEAVRKSDRNILPGSDLVFTIFNEKLKDIPSSELSHSIDRLIDKANNSIRPPEHRSGVL